MPSTAVKARRRAIAAGAPMGIARRDSSSKLQKDPAKDKAGRAVLDTIGRPHLINVLSAIVPSEDTTSPEYRLLAYLQSNEFDGHSVTKLMRDAGLVLSEIVDLVRNHDIALGVLRAASHVPDVLEDIAVDAKSQIVCCPTCGGRRVIAPDGVDLDDKQMMELLDLDPDTMPKCAVCNGVGMLRQLGDSDSRKILLETMGIYNKRGPQVAIQRNVQVNNYGGGSAPEDVSVRVAKMLEPGK